MAIEFPDDYWVEIPGGRYTVGLLPDEARRLAEVSAKFALDKGVPYTPNEMKNMGRAATLIEQHGNADWVTAYLLDHYPARTVEIAPFAIARRPVLGSEWRRFMAATGEAEPGSWRLDPNRDESLAVHGLDWSAAVAFCAWVGARMPFEDEWEVAARGPERRLFPWGDALDPHGGFLQHNSTVFPLDPAMATPTGILGMLSSGCEWCADPWSIPKGLDPARWRDDDAWSDMSHAPQRRTVRAESDGRIVPSAISRYLEPIHCRGIRYPRLRLVRSDGRSIPKGPKLPAYVEADLAIREFDVHRLRRIYREIEASPLAQENRILVDGNRELGDRELRFFIGQQRRDALLFDEFTLPDEPQKPRGGSALVLVSRESIRRNPPEHGIYIWTCQFRLDPKTNQVGARPVVTYRMHFNKRMHVFVHRFDPNKEWTPLVEVTDAQIRKHIADTYAFYSQHADADRSPF
jgi:formylglycine-generating enzyme required for sulfatase activity